MPIQQCIFTSCWGQLFGGRLENNDLYCIELYLNAAYYCKHPSFVSTFSEHGTSFNSLESGCGRTNTSLRGHRDDAQYHSNIGEYSDGRVGNFIELLNFAVRRGDKVLENHLQNHQKNASYISKTSQNKLISCCGQVITDKLISEVKNSKYFSILADEACDSAVKEQLSLVLRYVDSEYNIKEDVFRFVHCKEGLSGKEYVQFFSNV